MGPDAAARHRAPVCSRRRRPVQFEIRAPQVFGASKLSACDCCAFVHGTQLNAVLQPAVETPVGDSPMAQRVREEGATLFQGFSFERPSLLQRRRSRPQREPVEDCFADSALSADLHCSQQCGQWFDVPPPDTSEAGHPTVPAEYDHPTVPAEYDDVEDEILGAGRLKSVGFTGSRPKVSCTSRDHLQVAS